VDTQQETQSLTRISTPWSLIQAAKQSQGDGVHAARHRLLERYRRAVHRYLLARLRDPHAADQVASDFALRVLEGDAFLQRAVPGPSAGPKPGRFRYYLKAVLSRMVIDYYRRKSHHPHVPINGDEYPVEWTVSPDPGSDDDAFIDCWRQEMLNHAWEALEDFEHRTRQPYCTVFLCRQENPKLRSADLAAQLSVRLGRRFSPDGIRQLLRRGRELFGRLLVEEVARSMRETPGAKVTAAQVEEELIELRLLFSYCKAALERYAAKVG
jgi:DNA-directed RNA polymerase specialized sigma24 family protein